MRPLRLVQSQALHHQSGRLLRLPLVGVALGDIRGRDPVIGKKQVRSRAHRFPVRLYFTAQGLDVAAVVVVVVDDAQIRQAARTLERAIRAVDDSAGGGSAILWKQRQDQQFVDTL